MEMSLRAEHTCPLWNLIFILIFNLNAVGRRMHFTKNPQLFRNPSFHLETALKPSPRWPENDVVEVQSAGGSPPNPKAWGRGGGCRSRLPFSTDHGPRAAQRCQRRHALPRRCVLGEPLIHGALT